MRAQYQDQLAKKRYEDQLLQQQKSQEEILRKWVLLNCFLSNF